MSDASDDVKVGSLSNEQLDNLKVQRDKRVGPVVQEIKKLLVSKELLLSDTFYIEQMVNQQLKVIIGSVIYQHFNDIFELVQRDLELAVNLAHNELWGKDKDDVTWKDVDDKVVDGVKKKKIPKEE